jgi:hypothetical protein
MKLKINNFVEFYMDKHGFNIESLNACFHPFFKRINIGLMKIYKR